MVDQSTIDANVYIGRWPFRHLPCDTAQALIGRLEEAGISQAWVGALEGLFQRDVAGVNLRLAEECRAAANDRLLAFGTVNPALPDWEDDLRRCHEEHRFAGIRLHPGFHGYRLDDARFASLLAQAAQRGLVVQLVVTMEDERTQHPVFRVPAVDLGPLIELVRQLPVLRLVLLNAFRTVSLDDASRLAAAGRVYFDIATLEGADRVASLVQQVGQDRVLFGSHFPLFYLESAQLKLRETALPAGVVRAIRHENARRLLE
ncbi:MAG: amidohydrolase family protein [Pirellulales bacterium]